MPFSIWLKDTDGKYLFFNRKFIDDFDDFKESKDDGVDFIIWN